ncbi:MAG: PRC-barrel domain-containing protein [Syntrophomonadaceae bacterium]|nr:PRC-barrel domain-containing protein [Syntrophomonadaceae bacterium]
MKLRNVKDLPVFDRKRAEVIARVERAVIGDDCELAYLVINVPNRGTCMILKDDLKIEAESVVIDGLEGIKSYAHGEESSVYEKKIGDTVFDYQGKELGVVSDFILSSDNKGVWGLEVSSGAILDILEGRMELPLENVAWKSSESGIAELEGSDLG